MSDKELFIRFSGDVTADKITNLFNSIDNALANDIIKTIRIGISSKGGDISAAINGYHQLQHYKKRCKLITYNTGCVDSAATILFLAADERYCLKYTSFLIHSVRVLSTWYDDGL